MLILTRRIGQRLLIEPLHGLDPATPVGELFREGPIVITVCRVDCQQVRLGIDADANLLVVRQELHGGPHPGHRRPRIPHDH